MDEKQVESIVQFAKSLEGAVIHSNATSELQFIKDSKDKAKKHVWIYHCTNAAALKNILKSREFWLTNLKFVNDKKEAERINSKEYENTFYVSSFTYDPCVDKTHWKEYGTLKDGVLVAVKPSWFKREAYFLCSGKRMNDDFYTIWRSYEEAMREKMTEQTEHNRITNPFYIASFGVYQVLYDDNLVKKIYSDSTISGRFGKLTGKSVIPEVAGIIKNTKGLCERDNSGSYEKDWESEKEVRLKVRVHQLEHIKNGNEYHDGMILPFPITTLAVPLTDDAFSELRIRFSPEFENPEGYLEELRNVLGTQSSIKIF